MATVDVDRRARVLDVHAGEEPTDLNHQGVLDVAFSPAGRLLATAGFEGIKLWAGPAG
jgi:WD40 repeat protein